MGSELSLSRWENLTERLGLPPLKDTFSKLQSAHSEQHRAYHTAEHINACLRHLDTHKDKAERPDLIELAIWFHDAIYKPMSKTNEADSAEIAREHLGTYLSSERMDWIDNAIRLTQTHGDTQDADTALLLDIDLSILATPSDVYRRYTRDVRREYRWVPRPLYRAGRRKVLQHFLDMPRIYKTDRLADEWEDQARTNLANELENL